MTFSQPLLAGPSCDPNGDYLLVKPAQVQYICGGGLVSVDIESFSFQNGGALVLGKPTLATDLIGAATNCPSGNFDVSGSISGNCLETHRLSGAFSDQNVWNGNYTISFSGACLDCQFQSFEITAERPAEDIFADSFEDGQASIFALRGVGENDGAIAD